VRRDGGPALSRETRVGPGGRPFALLRFRTATVGSGEPTPVGRVLRRYCLDELPQLLNVLGGSMALVGPRPLWPDRAPDSPQRLLVKPGITGLWLLDGGSNDLSGDQSALLDLLYVENWSPTLDLRVLLRTVRAAVGGDRRA
jgi:lipopolysaccharide/colanic/teichoic acid biosynthesis glycosyltransferase